jgi:hypothetical protein
MRQDIPQAVVEALGFYVYRLVDPRTGETFYVGKGCGERVLQHAWDALSDPMPSDKLDRIRQIRAAGHVEMLMIHRHGLDEPTAFHVEAALIDAYPGLTNRVRGQGAEQGAATLDDLVDRYAAPDAVIPMSAILIKVEQEWRPDLTPEQLYERTRRYWSCVPEGRSPPPTHAIAVARGLIREVYRIERWESYNDWLVDRDTTRLGDPHEPWPAGRPRRGFVGSADAAYSHLKRCSVRHLVQAGSQNPIAYVNC